MGKRQSARSPCEQPARGKRSARAQPVRRRSPPEQPVTLLTADFHIPPPNNHRQQHKVIDTRREAQPNRTARHGPPTGGRGAGGAAQEPPRWGGNAGEGEPPVLGGLEELPAPGEGCASLLAVPAAPEPCPAGGKRSSLSKYPVNLSKGCLSPVSLLYLFPPAINYWCTSYPGNLLNLESHLVILWKPYSACGRCQEHVQTCPHVNTIPLHFLLGGHVLAESPPK